MRRFISLLLVATGMTGITTTAAQAAEPRLRLATTTSTRDSGLLDHLLPHFEKHCACKLDVIAVGTGKALELGKRGDVDVLLVHAPRQEELFVAQGHGLERRHVMHNDFVLVGPESDPVGMKRAKTTKDALSAIAVHSAPFISRGDRSGTHEKERELWQAVGPGPRGKGYIEAGQGMSEVLAMADEKRAYTLTDRGTFVAFKRKLALRVLFEGDSSLENPYAVIAVNPEKHPGIRHALAAKLVDFLTGKEGQRLIRDYKVNGQQLFFIP